MSMKLGQTKTLPKLSYDVRANIAGVSLGSANDEVALAFSKRLLPDLAPRSPRCADVASSLARVNTFSFQAPSLQARAFRSGRQVRTFRRQRLGAENCPAARLSPGSYQWVLV